MRRLSVLVTLSVFLAACGDGAEGPEQAPDLLTGPPPGKGPPPGQGPPPGKGPPFATFYAVGEQGTLLKFNGLSWRSLTSGTNADLVAVSGADENNVWVAGTGTILRTADGGVTWSDVTPGGFSAGPLHGDIWVSDPNTAWAVGANGLVLKTTNGGATWTDCSLPAALATVVFGGVPLPIDLLSIWGASSNVLFVTGRLDGLIASTADGCQTWVREAPNNPLRADDPNNAGLGYLDLWGMGPAHVYAVGEGSTLLRFDGSTWSEDVPPVLTFYTGVWGADSQHAWVAGPNAFPGVIAHTSDGGANWAIQIQFRAGSEAWDMWGTSGSQIIAVGLAGSAYHYDGSSWTAVSTGVSQNLRDVWGIEP